MLTDSTYAATHGPGSGVKTYVPLAVLEMIDGLQVPESPLSEVVGSVGTADPSQKLVARLKVGTIELVIVTFKVYVVAHAVDGVKT